MSIKGQGHSLTLAKGHSDFKVKCLTGLYTQVSDSGPHGPLVYVYIFILVNKLVKLLRRDCFDFGVITKNKYERKQKKKKHSRIAFIII